ncbi:MAG TPA: ATP synthase F0 subunit B [Terriglobales bacterium]|nr:ATP synthase F0 subunit B [Terriglobales bacterium]
MDETLRQLGGLLLGSIPTIVFFVLLYLIYTILVHKPLLRILAERRSKTEGAIEQARKAIALAESRTEEYERRLREARVAVFKIHEARRHEASQLRSAAVSAARAKAQAQVEEARAAIQKDKVAAQDNLKEESARLAQEIIRVVLRPATEQAPAGRQ